MKKGIIILVLGIRFVGIGCSRVSDFFSAANSQEILENERLKDENLGLRFSLDSLSDSFNSMFKDYNAIKNKRSDTVFVFSPVDSIRWIDSVRYIFRDSVIFIPHDTLIIHLKDSLVYNFKDSTVFSYRDSILYNYRDSVVVSYDDRTFPEDSIVSYLNLFFRTDDVSDTAGLRFNFLVFDGKKLSYRRDSLYSVPDSVVGWRMEWWKDDCKITCLR